MSISSICYAFNEYIENWEERKAQTYHPPFGGRPQAEKRTEDEKSMHDLEKILTENSYTATDQEEMELILQSRNKSKIKKSSQFSKLIIPIKMLTTCELPEVYLFSTNLN